MAILNEQKPPLEEALAHFGVKGMKWGVRRGNLRSRIGGVVADTNHNRTAHLVRRRENRPATSDEKIDRAIALIARGGTNRLNKRIDIELRALEKQRKRIEAGKLAAIDILSIIARVKLIDLVISRRDNRG